MASKDAHVGRRLSQDGKKEGHQVPTVKIKQKKGMKKAGEESQGISRKQFHRTES
jgi:hypothetical protein